MVSRSTPSRPTACPNREEWSAFYLGKLPADVVQTLAEHLEQCTECSSSLQALEGEADELVRQLRRPSANDSSPSDSASRQRTPDILVPSQLRRIGPYRLLCLVGEGSMGSVYEAFHEAQGRIVAIKTLSRRRADDPSAVARFRREIEAVCRLDHPHIVRAIDAGESDGVLFLAMEFVEGTDLARVLRQRGPLPAADACELMRQAALGLHHAHLHGLIHRDVKPSNLLLGVGGQVKVLDLGLALPPPDSREESSLTSSGLVLGTLDYMAPEQSSDSHSVDARTDVYGLGCTLYHLLTGHVPFAGSRHATPQSKMWAHAFETPPSLGTECPHAGPELSSLLDRLLAKDPAARIPTAAEVAVALAPFTAGADLPALLSERDGASAPRRVREQAAASAIAQIKPRKGSVVRRWLLPATAATLLLLGVGAFALHQLSGKAPLPHPTAIARDVPLPPDDDPLQNATPPAAAPPKAPAVYPAALFAFEERGAGAREMGQKVTDLLFARLAAKDNLTLVDREDLKKTLGEAELNLSGAVKAAEATKVGQLTGAKILVTGSVIHSDKKLFLVAKIIGTETSRVVGASVDGKLDDELESLVAKLADKVAEVVTGKADDLVAKVVPKGDRIASLKEKLKKGPKPTVMVKVTEKHIGAVTIDPAAQTELLLILKECGFEVIDAEEGEKVKADVIVSGEGLSTFASRRGNLMTVTGRLEVKAVERATDRVLAADRQTVVVVELTEALAGKAALQEAAVQIAGRLLPKLLKEAAVKLPE